MLLRFLILRSTHSQDLHTSSIGREVARDKRVQHRRTYLEDFKTGDIEDAHKGNTSAFGTIEGLVDAGNKPTEETLIDGLRDGLNGEFDLLLGLSL